MNSVNYKKNAEKIKKSRNIKILKKYKHKKHDSYHTGKEALKI